MVWLEMSVCSLFLCLLDESELQLFGNFIVDMRCFSRNVSEYNKKVLIKVVSTNVAFNGRSTICSFWEAQMFFKVPHVQLRESNNTS